MRLVHWISKTDDKKTGPVMASYSPKSSCPDTCSLKEGGCYAWGLFYLRILGSKIENGKITPKSFREALKESIRGTKIVRHRIAGDVVGDVPGTLQDCKDAESEGFINVGYTHAWRQEEVQPLKKYFRASCQSVEEVLQARQAGWEATLIVGDMGGNKRMSLPNGETAYLCPARRDVPGKKDITCNDCTLCKVTPSTAGKTVIFEAHGNHSTMKKILGKVA